MVRFNKKICNFLIAMVAAFSGFVIGSVRCKAIDLEDGFSANPYFEVSNDGVLMSYSGTSETVVIPENVRSISFGVFMDHSEIKNVKFPKNLVEVNECAFYGCDGLKKIILPDGLTHIGRLAFGNCEFLQELFIGKNVTDMLELITYGCPNLEKISVDPDNAVYASVDGILYSKSLDTLISCPQNHIGRVVILDSVVTIKEYAFFDCNKIEEVVMGSSVKYIDEASFYGCKNLKKINLSGEVKKVRSYSFAECEALTDVLLGKNVNYVGQGAFFKCPNLKTITFLTSEVGFGEDVFAEGGEQLTICASENSSAHTYAQNHAHNFELIH